MGLEGRLTESLVSSSLTIGTLKDGTSRLERSSVAFSNSLAAPVSPRTDFFWVEPSWDVTPVGSWGGRGLDGAGDNDRALLTSLGGKSESVLPMTGLVGLGDLNDATECFTPSLSLILKFGASGCWNIESWLGISLPNLGASPLCLLFILTDVWLGLTGEIVETKQS